MTIRHGRFLAAGFLSALTTFGLIAGCGSGISSGTQATASVMVSDPATCMAPTGPFEHVYVTITDVKAHVNPSAPDNDPSFVDLTPKLASSPKQIDLLGQASNKCFLATLGDPQQLQAGNYQQIRLFLADNSASVANNACNGSANCVVLSDGSIHPLLLSSESKTGIKIPSGQIANGGFNIATGQTKDLDIDFNTCVSIVDEGNGKFRLKTVLHAGEVSTTSSSINGIVLDRVTGNPVSGRVMVALEQKDATGIDRVFMSTMADASGAFVFCPLPTGTYDVVIVAESSAGVAYAPAIVTGVATGSALTKIALTAPTGAGSAPATLQGSISTQSGASPAAASSADLQVSFLETPAAGLTVTVPLLPQTGQSSAVLALSSAAGSGCAAGSDCASYSAALPASAPLVGAFSASGTTLTQSTSAPSYLVDALAYVPSSGGTSSCTPSELESGAVVPVAGGTKAVATLAFTGCQ